MFSITIFIAGLNNANTDYEITNTKTIKTDYKTSTGVHVTFTAVNVNILHFEGVLKRFRPFSGGV
jgi:hypothetical protein